MPKVSVIIPSYNAEAYIEEALASVRAQTLPDVEVVLVDDGSRDRTVQVAQRFLGAMDLRILEQANAGPAAARNFGIRSARADYCAFLDSDDLMVPERLAAQVQVLDADEEISLVHTDLQTFNEGGVVHATRRAFSDPCGGRVLDRLLLDNFITTSTVMARKSRLLEAGLFNVGRRVSEDYELWLKMSQRWPIAYLEQALTRYRYSPGSLSHNKFVTGRSALEVVEEFWSRNPDYARTAAHQRRRSLARHLAFTGTSASKEGKRGAALAYLLRSLANEPGNAETWKNLAKALVRATQPSPKPARIALIGSYPPPHGGQSVHIENLKRYLDSQGLEVVVFNTGSNKQNPDSSVISVRSAWELFNALYKRGPFKLLHVHVTDQRNRGKLVPVAVGAKLTSTPWIATIHSGNSVAIGAQDSGVPRLAARLLLGAATKLIAVNAAIERHLNKLTQTQTAVTIVPFSLADQRAPLPAALDAFLRAHDPVMVCVGLYEPTYGFDQAVRLLQAMRKTHPEMGLLLIGEKSRAQWCETLIRELQLESNVYLCGDLEHEACLTAISRTALFLRPTLYDGDSLSVREALALGVPVVATATDFRPEGVVVYSREDEHDLQNKALAALARASAIGSGTAGNDQRNLQKVYELYRQVIQ